MCGASGGGARSRGGGKAVARATTHGIVGGSEGRGGEKARMCVLFVSLSESAVRREPV